MTGQQLIILFEKDKAYLTPEKSLMLPQLNLPDVAKSFEKSYWVIRVRSYNEEKRRLFCDIISYELGDTIFPENQLANADILCDVETIGFSSINTDKLLRAIEPLSSGITVKPIKGLRYTEETFKSTITEIFYVPIKDTQFKLGGVTFYKRLNGYKKIVEFRIDNPHIKEEFDAIKNYFANILDTKKIQVTATIDLEDDEIVSVKASSTEIDKINIGLIEDIKFRYLKAMISRKVANEKADSLLTIDEYFEAFSKENLNTHVFYDNEQELINDLSRISNAKHYNHLRYLSSKHLHEKLKLRLIHTPLSFLFLIEGNKGNYFVWETLSTEEATYIWKIYDNSIDFANELQKIETIIRGIKEAGKKTYINSKDDKFYRINHEYSDIVNGFTKWKSELETIIL